MIAGPITDREYDPEKEKRLVRASKRKILEYLESESFLGTGKQHFLIFPTKTRIQTGLKNTMKEKLLIQKKGSIAKFVFHFVYLLANILLGNKLTQQCNSGGFLKIEILEGCEWHS